MAPRPIISCEANIELQSNISKAQPISKRSYIDISFGYHLRSKYRIAKQYIEGAAYIEGEAYIDISLRDSIYPFGIRYIPLGFDMRFARDFEERNAKKHPEKLQVLLSIKQDEGL